MADKLPDYGFLPLKMCMDSISTMGELLHLSIHGLSMVSKLPEVMKAAMEWDRVAGTENTTTESDIERVTNNATFANNERKEGFPFFHSFTLVGTWAALEAGVEDMLVGMLCNEPAILQRLSSRRFAFRFRNTSGLIRRTNAIPSSEIQRDQSSGLAQGVNAFETVLNVFAMSGPIDPAIKGGLWKLSNSQRDRPPRFTRRPPSGGELPLDEPQGG